MITMRNVLLADDMGLGKSLSAITLFALDVYQGYSKTCLVVCPASLKANWENEFRKFTKQITISRIGQTSGTPSATKDAKRKVIEKFAALDEPRVMITNYEQVASMLEDYKKIRWDMVILDEAHMIKNPKAKRTRAVQALQTRRSILLTGSPVLNHVNDLWSLMRQVVGPDSMESYYRFVNRYARFGGWQDKQIIGVKNERELNARIQNIMVRRLKEDVLDLPEVVYTQRVIDLGKTQAKLYREIFNNMQLTKSDGEIEEIDNILTKYLRLKQVCGTTAAFIDKDDSGKLDAALWDALDILTGNKEKVVVFTQFRAIQEAFRLRLESARGKHAPKMGPAFNIYVIHGDIDSDTRQEIVNQWADDPKPSIILCMFQVAGVGLNMTAARYGLMVDKLYVPDLNKQAVDRMHRIGADKTQPVTIIEYIARDTVEHRVEEILKQKSKVSKELLEDNEVHKLAIKQAILDEKKNKP